MVRVRRESQRKRQPSHFDGRNKPARFDIDHSYSEVGLVDNVQDASLYIESEIAGVAVPPFLVIQADAAKRLVRFDVQLSHTPRFTF